MLSRLAAIILSCVLLAPAEAEEPKPTVVIGLIDTFDPDFYLDTFVPTIDYLKAKLPQYHFVVKELNSANLTAQIEEANPAFIISSATDYTSLIDRKGALPIVAKLRQGATDVARSVASTIVVRADNPAVNNLIDLKGKSIAATDEKDFDGWLITQYEISKFYKDPPKFFGRTVFTRYNYPDPITYVRVGQTDAAILSTCQYEKLVSTGQLDPLAFKIINKKASVGGCVRSTDLFPDVVLYSLPAATPAMVKNLTVALLSMPNPGHFEWVTPTNFVKVFDLLRALRMGPYSGSYESFADFIYAHKQEVYLFLLFLAALFIHIIRVNRLVRLRTEELKKVLEIQREAEKKAAENRKKLDLLEKNNAVSQMSSMFAHEVKQPITNVIYYVSGLKMLLGRYGFDNAEVNQVIQKIGEQARRTADIVEHVRNYAKKKPRKEVIVDLAEVADHVLRSLEGEEKQGITLKQNFETGSMVKIDRFEIELVILNLIKNALAAVKDLKNPEVDTRIYKKGDAVIFEVQDNGPPIDDYTFSNLGQPVQSKKAGGLGIGLLIAQSIVESHGGNIRFDRNVPVGLTVSFQLKLQKEAANVLFTAVSTNS